MADKLFGLTERERDLVQRVVDIVRGDRKNTTTQGQGRDKAPIRSSRAETYIAKTKEMGVDARDDSDMLVKPGFALCDIYTIQDTSDGQDPVFVDLDFDELVFNITGDSIGEDEWIVVNKDKFGNWIANVGGSGGGTGLTDGCECDNSLLSAGSFLSGSPTICCTGHERFSLNLGSQFGDFVLYHAGGDIWSTFNSDGGLDNPWVNDCGGGSTDEYDIVMDIAANTITLEARAALNCAEVCFEYRRDDLFGCVKGNQFELAKFDFPPFISIGGNNVRAVLPPCVCVEPLLTVPAAECACFSEVFPLAYMKVNIGTGWGYVGACCCYPDPGTSNDSPLCCSDKIDLLNDSVHLIEPEPSNPDCYNSYAVIVGEEMCTVSAVDASVFVSASLQDIGGGTREIVVEVEYITSAETGVPAPFGGCSEIGGIYRHELTGLDCNDIRSLIEDGTVFTLAYDADFNQFGCAPDCGADVCESPPIDPIYTLPTEVYVEFIQSVDDPTTSGHCTPCGT